MQLNKSDLEKMEQRYRATFINSLAGFKTALLIGSKSADGFSNLAIFNSLIHIGANPPMYGFLCRPDTVKRDTLSNILETNYYTFNYVKSEDYKKAHQTSAKYEREVSEFEKTGFTETYINNFFAPFAQEAVVKIGLRFEEKIDIKINGTILIIGSIENIEMNADIISEDGFVALEKENVLACTGLDAYYHSDFIGRLSYAKPERWPEKID